MLAAGQVVEGALEGAGFDVTKTVYSTTTHQDLVPDEKSWHG